MADQNTVSVAQQRALKIPSDVKSLIEGFIFAAEEPLTVRQIKAIYEQPGVDEERRIDQAEIQTLVESLNEEYRLAHRPYRIIMIAGGYQFATLKEYAEWLGRLFHEQARRRLSQSSLETLAIVSYKQPISKPEIEAIRGVNCDYVLKTLLEKELLTIVGRAETVGRPLLYGTTREFLKHFGLNEITDLPRPREIEEILGESQFETERRMLEAQAGADLTKKEEEDFKSRLPHIPRKKSELNEEVQIIPKTRTRTLNLRAKEEAPDFPAASPVDESEVPGVVEGGHPVVTDQKDERSVRARPPIVPAIEMRIPEASNPPRTIEEVPSVKEIPEIGEENSLLPTGEDHFGKDRVIPADEPPVPPNFAEPASDIGREVQENRVPLSIPSIPPIEPEQTQPRRSPWTSWKAKIQTFIRKLFG
ncbi:MAG: SMC-Scp complex subunit ScpB [Bacteroidota bacterium]